MKPPISPWHTDTIQIASPDGSIVAILEDPSEIAMGAPTSGHLKLSNGQSAESCNPSLVWSDDSRYLAVPQWFDRHQRLVILDTHFKRRKFAPATYRVLELHSFINGVIEGIDSPIYQPIKIKFEIKDLG